MSGVATSGQPSSTVEHDVKGNVTLIEGHYGMKSDDMALFWDFDNRMSSADSDNDGFKNVIQKFDALGRRVSRFDDDSNATTIFPQFGQQTICDYAAGASPSTSKYRYLYGSYIDEPVMRWETAQSDAVYYHRNGQYSVVAITDDNGAIIERYSYTAYGDPAFFDGSGTLLSPQSSALDNRYTYTGREYDSTIRLYHYRARMYDPQLGRFLARDPIGFDGGSLNLHQFLDGRPISETDSSGMITATRTSGVDYDRSGFGACSPGISKIIMDYNFDYFLSPQVGAKPRMMVVIRKINVECGFQKCPCRRNIEGDTFTFFEAIFSVKPIQLGSNPYFVADDRVAWTKDGRGHCGYYYQSGETKAFFIEDIQHLAGSRKENWMGIREYPTHRDSPCKTRGGPLTREDLDWFDALPGSNPPTPHRRYQTLDFHCCESNDDRYKTTSNP